MYLACRWNEKGRPQYASTAVPIAMAGRKLALFSKFPLKLALKRVSMKEAILQYTASQPEFHRPYAHTAPQEPKIKCSRSSPPPELPRLLPSSIRGSDARLFLDGISFPQPIIPRPSLFSATIARGFQQRRYSQGHLWLPHSLHPPWHFRQW